MILQKKIDLKESICGLIDDEKKDDYLIVEFFMVYLKFEKMRPFLLIVLLILICVKVELTYFFRLLQFSLVFDSHLQHFT